MHRARDSMRLGWHWILDAQGCDQQRLGSRDELQRLLCALPDELGLTRVAEPQIHVHEGAELTLVGMVLLAESHFSLHARPERSVLHADLFSCVAFDEQRALDLTRRAYGFTAHHAQAFERSALAPELAAGE